MKTMKIVFRSTIALMFLLLACNAWAQATKDKEVVVVNPPTNPVPVAGLVGITGTPSVQVQGPVPVTGSVGINGTVEVHNVNDAIQTPFWGHAGETIPINYISYNINVGLIPAGQRLIIEHVALRCLSDPDDSFPEVMIWVSQKVGMGYSGYAVPLFAQKQGTTYDGKASWVVSQSLKLYSDGGSSTYTTVNVAHSKTTATASCFTHVSGYTINTP